MTDHSPIVLDIAGLALDADDRRRLQHPLVGGLILFARNWRDRLQLTELTAEIKSLRPDLLISVDHEGGHRLERLASEFEQRTLDLAQATARNLISTTDRQPGVRKRMV